MNLLKFKILEEIAVSSVLVIKKKIKSKIENKKTYNQVFDYTYPFFLCIISLNLYCGC